MDRTVEMLFALIRKSLIGGDLPDWLPAALTPESALRLYELSRAHDLAHLAADALDSAGLLDKIPPETAERFQNRLLKAVYRCERSQYELNRICAALESEKIDYIPLKGSVIRAFYPEPWMRTTVDIDILVRQPDLSRAVGLFLSRGYARHDASPHDVALKSPEGVVLELHHTMLALLQDSPAYAVVEKVWDYAHPAAEGSKRYVLDGAMFNYLHIAHMAEHFESGGCGVRPFVDLWVLRRAGVYRSADRDLSALLEQGGLTRFAAACEYLTDCWMAPETATPGDARLVAFGNYILSGGVYGNVANMVAIGKAKQREGYVRSRLFQSKQRLESYYPVLRKHGWMRPFLQVWHWIRRIFRRGPVRYLRELRLTRKIPEDERQEYVGLRGYLGL